MPVIFEMNHLELNPSEVLEAIAPTVQIGRKEYVAGRICFAMMFFIPPDGTFSTPPRMIEALARVEPDFPPEFFEFWDADGPYQSGAAPQQPPPDPKEALAAFMDENKTHVTGTFAGRRWNGALDGTVPTTQLVSWFYDRIFEQDSHRDVDRSNTFQVNIPLTILDNLKRLQLTQRLFADLCNILQPLFAVGGLCMTTPLDPVILRAQQEKEVLLPLLENHPGPLFGSAFDMSGHTRWRMSAVNWLTAIRGDLLKLCGGPEAVLAQLGRPGFHTAQFSADGLLIQAGPSPQLGKSTEGTDLSHYGDLARALKPARLQVTSGRMPHMAYYGPEDALYSDEVMAQAQNAGLARFDAMT